VRNEGTKYEREWWKQRTIESLPSTYLFFPKSEPCLERYLVSRYGADFIVGRQKLVFKTLAGDSDVDVMLSGMPCWNRWYGYYWAAIIS
jgi:hypothetical protein